MVHSLRPVPVGIAAGRNAVGRSTCRISRRSGELPSQTPEALTAAGILDSVTGPSGGYRLARAPADISLLDIVEAIDGKEPTFRCTEIRQRGPCALKSSAYPKPCGINRAMLRAEAAYRTALADENLQAIADGFIADVNPDALVLTKNWLAENMRMPKS